MLQVQKMYLFINFILTIVFILYDSLSNKNYVTVEKILTHILYCLPIGLYMYLFSNFDRLKRDGIE